MTRILRRIVTPLALVGLAMAALPLVGQDASDDPAPDYARPQSPARPQPQGLAFIEQGGSDKRLKGYRTPEGFKVEIVAEDPVVVHPAGLAFADDGTPHVLEWVGAPDDPPRETVQTIKYKDGSSRRIVTLRKKKKDVVKVLTSSKKDGVFDKARVVLEDEASSGLLLYDGWIYLSGRGSVRRFKQSKAGGPYDKQEVAAQGFAGSADASGLTLGNDGWLYITAGDNDHFVEGSDGSRATVLRTGAIFRCKPDGSKLHTYAMGFCNPRGAVAFDLGGNLFHIDADIEGKSKFTGCRLVHVPEGADFGWRLAGGARCCRPDPVRAAAFGELPGKMPPLLKTGRGEPAGLFICNDSRLPEAYRGLIFYPDPDRRLIRAYKVEQAGASFKVVEEFPFLTADKDPLFRPSQMVLGPDGAVYIVDRRAPPGGPGVHGRIYRVSWSGTKDHPALPLRDLDSWAKIAKLPDEDLIKTLSGEEASDRERARRELVKRGDKNRKALIRLLTVNAPLAGQIVALGALQSMIDAGVLAAFAKALKEGDAELQRVAAEALGLCAPTGDRDAQTALLQALSSEDLSVRRAVAVAMGRLRGPGAGDNLATALSFDESKDVVLRDGILRGLEMLGKPGVDALIALADSGVQKDTDRVVEAFLGLRSREAFAALPTLLKHMHVADHQRAELIRSIPNYLLDPPVSLEAVVAQVTSQAKETTAVKKVLLEVLAVPGALKGPKAEEWVLSQLSDASAELRLQALVAVEQMRLARAAPVLVKRLGAEKLPDAERLAVIHAFRGMPAREALPTLTALLGNAKAAVRQEAFRSLSDVDASSAMTAVKAMLTGKDSAAQLKATGAAGATVAGARLVGTLYLEKKLPEALRPEVAAALRRHAAKDPEAKKLLAEVMK